MFNVCGLRKAIHQLSVKVSPIHGNQIKTAQEIKFRKVQVGHSTSGRIITVIIYCAKVMS